MENISILIFSNINIKCFYEIISTFPLQELLSFPQLGNKIFPIIYQVFTVVPGSFEHLR